MSNIKFIYQKKVHKVPQNVNSFSEVVKTIKTVYKQLNGIYLYAVVNPDSADGVAEINSDVAFKQLKQLYAQLGWPSIKLLVTEDQNIANVIRDSWGLLNQSQVIVDKKSHDVATFFQPQQSDQQLQIAPQADNRSTQVKIQQADNGQNTGPTDFRNNEQLKQLIIEIIDERLQFYGLIQKPKQIEKNEYKFLLSSKIPIFTAQPQKKMNISFDIRNNGSQTWYKAFLVSKALNISQQLNNVSPNQTVNVTIEIQNPVNQKETIVHLFQIICQNEKQEIIELEGTIPVTVKPPQHVSFENQQTNDEMNIEKLLAIFPQKGKTFLTNFVKTKGANKGFEEIIELLLNQF